MAMVEVKALLVLRHEATNVLEHAVAFPFFQWHKHPNQVKGAFITRHPQLLFFIKMTQ